MKTLDRGLRNRKAIESKSKITSVCLKPSTHLKFQKIAFEMNRSANGVINELIEGFIVQNQDLVEEYDKKHPEG